MARRNKYAGPCYRCQKTVEAGQGHFERVAGSWRVQHASCAIEHRGTDFGKSDADLKADEQQEALREKWRLQRLLKNSQASGKRGNKARRSLRAMGVDFPTPPHLAESST